MIFYVAYEQRRYIMNIMYENRKKDLNEKFISRQEMCFLMFAFIQSIVRTKNISQKIMSVTYAERKKNSIENSLADKKCVC